MVCRRETLCNPKRVGQKRKKKKGYGIESRYGLTKRTQKLINLYEGRRRERIKNRKGSGVVVVLRIFARYINWRHSHTCNVSYLQTSLIPFHFLFSFPLLSTYHRVLYSAFIFFSYNMIKILIKGLLIVNLMIFLYI